MKPTLALLVPLLGLANGNNLLLEVMTRTYDNPNSGAEGGLVEIQVKLFKLTDLYFFSLKGF